MKRFFVLLAIVISMVAIIGCGTAPAAPIDSAAVIAESDELDLRIRDASDYLIERIPEGNKIVFLNITSDYPDLSEYILSELSSNAVNDDLFSVVDRQQLDAIRAELNFQYSGEVSDASAQEVGAMLGAQTIVSGSVRKIASLYRFEIKAIEVQSAGIQGQRNWNIPSGMTLAALTENVVVASASPAPSAAASAAPAAAQQTPPAESSQGTRQQPAPIVVEKFPTTTAPAPLQPGTYTFYPRPRALKNGLEVDVYLDKIQIRGGYMNLFFVNRPIGKGTGSLGAGNLHHEKIIQDLDRPSRSFNAPSGYTEDRATGAIVVTFQNVTARRFSFTNTAYGEVGFYFDEIILGDPDV